jgi:hypothetical protein
VGTIGLLHDGPGSLQGLAEDGGALLRTAGAQHLGQRAAPDGRLALGPGRVERSAGELL